MPLFFKKDMIISLFVFAIFLPSAKSSL